MIRGASRQRATRGSMIMPTDRTSGRGLIAASHRFWVLVVRLEKPPREEAFPPRPELEEETAWFYLSKS
jgi:hypothetical protein